MASFDPVGWLVSLVGCSIDWLLTRTWIKILLGAVPTFLLLVLAATVWIGGRLDDNALVDRYIELGRAEIGDWESKLVDCFQQKKKPTTDLERATSNSSAAGSESETNPPKSGESTAVANDPSQGDSESATSEDGQQERTENVISSFGELLFRRAQLQRPSPESQFVVGTTLLQRGAFTQGQKLLRSIAPDEKVGEPKGHAMMAMSYLLQYAKSPNNELVPLMTHHAEAAIPWEHTPKQVLYLASDINWQKNNIDRSLEILNLAAERFPDLYPMLNQRYLQAKKPEEAKAAKEKGISFLQSKLAEDPNNVNLRYMIAQLLGTSDEALVEVERLFKQAPDSSNEDIKRAISEVYRNRFYNLLKVAGGNKSVDLSLLERSLELDPTNPHVAEMTAMLVRDGFQISETLKTSLQENLKSSKATTATHATLSEYYVGKGRSAEAIKHLEEVFKVAPMAVMYANNLAFLYAQANRTDEALKVARTCLDLLQRNNLQATKHVDDLLDTLGMIYQKLDRSTDAVSAYETSLRFNPKRKDSRTKLASLYRKMGNEGVAQAHEQAIEAIKKEEQEQAEKSEAEMALATESSETSASDDQAKPEEDAQQSPAPAPTTAETPNDSPANELSDDSSAPNSSETAEPAKSP